MAATFFFFFLFLFLLSSFTPVFLQEVNDFQKTFCGEATATATTAQKFAQNSTYGRNLRSLFSSEADSGFYNVSSGTDPDRVYGVALCRGDLTPLQCRTCIENATRNLFDLCPSYKEALIFYDNCMLRYSPRPVFGLVDTFHVFWTYNPSNATNASAFNGDAWALMDVLKSRAATASPLKFAAGTARGPDFITIYGLAQCSPDMSQYECDSCFGIAINDFGKCCDGRKGARVVSPNCNMRYDLTQFYNISAVQLLTSPPAPSPPPPPGLEYGGILGIRPE